MSVDVTTNAGTSALEEDAFAEFVSALAGSPDGHDNLVDLLSEDHPVYDQRGAAAIVRMRGWVLLELSHIGVSETALPFVLEELESGLDSYLVAAAARALRSYHSPSQAFVPFVRRAMTNMSGRDEPQSFEQYGEYATSSTGTSAIHELDATLAWLGPMPQEDDRDDADENACCTLPVGVRNIHVWSRISEACETRELTFEDHNGECITFDEYFLGHPSFVVFFYTRCDNPLKCSLSITKLGRVQRLLEARGMAASVRTAAITYDPAFDMPHRLRAFAERRGVQLNASHRMLRATGNMSALRRRFRLGVNFIESLVNRHRIEAYVLDAQGQIAYSFERLRWDERAVVDRMADVLLERRPRARSSTTPGASLLLSAVGPIGLALFPKCPVCWAAYLSAAGIAGLERIRYSPWLQIPLAAAAAISLVSAWWRARVTGTIGPACLTTAGILAIALSATRWSDAAIWGVALTVSGSVLNTTAVTGAGTSKS